VVGALAVVAVDDDPEEQAVATTDRPATRVSAAVRTIRRGVRRAGAGVTGVECMGVF
jgi:hypothetical protein